MSRRCTAVAVLTSVAYRACRRRRVRACVWRCAQEREPRYTLDVFKLYCGGKELEDQTPIRETKIYSNTSASCVWRCRLPPWGVQQQYAAPCQRCGALLVGLQFTGDGCPVRRDVFLALADWAGLALPVVQPR